MFFVFFGALQFREMGGIRFLVVHTDHEIVLLRPSHLIHAWSISVWLHLLAVSSYKDEISKLIFSSTKNSSNSRSHFGYEAFCLHVISSGGHFVKVTQRQSLTASVNDFSRALFFYINWTVSNFNNQSFYQMIIFVIQSFHELVISSSSHLINQPSYYCHFVITSTFHFINSSFH